MRLLDEETGVLLPNVFNFLVEWEIKRSFRYQNFVTLLILEPDRQLEYPPNTLNILVNLINQNIRGTDLIGRIGKTRFGILLLASDVDGAYIITSRILDHISNYIFSQEKGQHLTVSIGGACFPIHSTSTEKSELFKEAEDAFKIAKKKGNSVYLPGVPVSEALESDKKIAIPMV